MKKTKFNQVSSVLVFDNVIIQTREWLREVGLGRNEAFVLWAGLFSIPEEFVVTTSIFPDQQVLRSPLGIGVYVDGEELFRINKWLFENRLELLAQVHTHPQEAFHSNTDDTFPMVTAAGQFSLVVPFFARAPIDINRCAVFRLNHSGEWLPISKVQVTQIFKVVK